MLDFNDSGVRVTHDGDKHVEEGDLCDQSGQKEYYPSHTVRTVELSVKLAQTQLILVQHNIDEVICTVRFVEGIFFTNAQDVKRIAKSEQDDYKEDYEVLDVRNSLNNQPHVKGRWVKESKPVKWLEPSKNHSHCR